jgi:hypothetical protein
VIERVLAKHLGRACRITCLAPEDVPRQMTTAAGEPPSSGDETDPKGPATPDSCGQQRPVALTPEDQRRLEAAKAIFEVVE